MKRKMKTVCALLAVTMLTACSGKNNSQIRNSGDVDMSWADKAEEEKNKPSFERPEAREIQVKTPDSKISEEDMYNPVFSVPSGFYRNSFTLELGCRDENAKIYYTLDGSEPTLKSKAYDGGIIIVNRSDEPNVYSEIRGVNPSGDYNPSEKVLKGTIVRAIAELPDGTISGISSGTFFVGIDRAENFGDVPVISILSDSDNFFDYDTGIYVLGRTHDEWLAETPGNKYKDGWQHKGNYSNKGAEWERPATIVYIPASDGFLDDENAVAKPGFQADLGIRIMGAASRGNMQKSFRLKCREEYGDKNIKYPLIADNRKSDGSGNVDKYKSFLLRNGGNDCDYAKFRDSFLQEMVGNRSFETQQAEPVVVFLDGEYWGAYVLTEDYSDNYLETNYGIDDEEIVIVKRWEIDEGEDEDIALFSEMYDFITGEDMSVAGNYEKACELLDVMAYAEYCAFNIYINNDDSIFKGNNWQMWRARTVDENNPYADGRWRPMAYDTEFSTGLYSDGKTYRNDMLNSAISSYGKDIGVKLLTSLLANNDFRFMFVNALCDMKNIDFADTKVTESLAAYEKRYKQVAPDTIKRFGPDWIVRWNDPDVYFGEKVRELRTWMSGRFRAFPEQIQKNFGFSEAVTVSVISSDYAKGGFRLNTSTVDFGGDFTGKYFTENGFSVTASPKGKSCFDHWEVENGSIDNEKSETAVVTPLDGCIVTAVYA